MAIGSSAQAATFTATGNPDDTLAGTTITAYATSETLDYTDINFNAKPTVNPAGDIQVTVLPVYGFSSDSLASMNVYTGVTYTNSTAITNEGNASDNITLTISCDFTYRGSGTWTVNVRRSLDDTLIGTLTVGVPSTTETVALAEDADYGFYHEIIPPLDGTGGSYLVLTTFRETTSTPTGEYTGANGLTYSGLGSKLDSTTYSLVRPNLTLTRTATVDAPTAGAYTGGIHDVVPGSIVTFKMTYSNLGDVSAESVILVDKISKATLSHFNRTGSCTYVDITMSQGDATGWTIWATEDTYPQKYYGDPTGWILVGTIESTSDYFPSGSFGYRVGKDGVDNIKWVKWEKQYVDPAEDNKTLTWGVTVR